VAQEWTRIILLCISCLQLPSLDDMAMLLWLLGKSIIRILSLLRELLQTLQLLRESTCHTSHQIILAAHSTFTEAQISSLSPFDTDLSFWVCDNAVTGHIYKNRLLFTGDLIPSIYEIGTAAGKSITTLMGTVTLRVTDDNGVKHSFVLDNVNYLPNLPVNLLSLQGLAELYPNEFGHPDRNGTGIRWVFNCHMMFWNKEQFCKTFRTASLGLPRTEQLKKLGI
jgi:hypothetical protein